MDFKGKYRPTKVKSRAHEKKLMVFQKKICFLRKYVSILTSEPKFRLGLFNPFILFTSKEIFIFDLKMI